MYKKSLNAWPRGKQLVSFPLDLNAPLGFAERNIEGLGEKKSLFPLGPVI